MQMYIALTAHNDIIGFVRAESQEDAAQKLGLSLLGGEHKYCEVCRTLVRFEAVEELTTRDEFFTAMKHRHHPACQNSST